MKQLAVHIYHNAFDGVMKFVATVSVDEIEPYGNVLDMAYHLTNTIDQPWCINESESLSVSAEVKTDGGCRSTSVGDLINIVEPDSTAHWYIVADWGFDPIEDPTI